MLEKIGGGGRKYDGDGRQTRSLRRAWTDVHQVKGFCSRRGQLEPLNTFGAGGVCKLG
jgi:hypothetical protein